MDHPELAGGKQVLTAAFGKFLALTAVILLSPLFALVMLAIKLDGRGLVFSGRPGSVRMATRFRSGSSAP